MFLLPVCGAGGLGCLGQTLKEIDDRFEDMAKKFGAKLGDMGKKIENRFEVADRELSTCVVLLVGDSVLKGGFDVVMAN